VDRANSLLDEAGFTREGDGIRQGPDGPLSIGILFQAEASSLIDLLVPALADVGVELVPESTEGPGGLFPRKFMGAYGTILLFYPGPVDRSQGRCRLPAADLCRRPDADVLHP